MNTAFVSGVLLASLIPSLALVQKPILAQDAVECENVHAHEPMLVYEVSGSTLAGQIDQTLVVYADGTMKFSTAAPGELGTCTSLRSTPIVATKLYTALANAGALTLCDDDMLAVDLPLHTLTLLKGADAMRGRTFSFWSPEHGYAAIDAILATFIAEQFGS